MSDETLEDLWKQADLLHRAGISHGRLNASNVLVTEDGPMLVDLSAATLGAPQTAIDIDGAELAVACTVLVGPERTLRHAIGAGWKDNLVRILPYLERAALTPHLRDLARSHEIPLKKLRADGAAAVGQKTPDVAPLRRVRPRDLVLSAVLIVAAYLLISKLAEIGFGTIYRELKHADPTWVVIALLLAQSSFIGTGVSVRGSVATPLPLLPCILLQSAIKFINLTVPSSAGRIGIDLRFLQRMGASPPQAVAAGALDDASETIVQAALFFVTLPSSATPWTRASSIRHARRPSRGGDPGRCRNRRRGGSCRAEVREKVVPASGVASKVFGPWPATEKATGALSRKYV